MGFNREQRLTDALSVLRDVVRQQNNTGASWHSDVFAKMMDGLELADKLLDCSDETSVDGLHYYDSVYDEIVAKRKATGVPMAMGKHRAANSTCCKNIIETMQEVGFHSAADWAIWMLWWRMMDWTTAKQVDEMRLEEITSLRQRIDQLEREKRGIGPEDQYA